MSNVQEIIKSELKKSNLTSYDDAREKFDWKVIESQFSWSQTGLMNMAYEAIDRHAESDKQHKVALYYSDNEREEKYTFAEMKKKSNQAANVLKNLGISKGDR